MTINVLPAPSSHATEVHRGITEGRLRRHSDIMIPKDKIRQMSLHSARVGVSETKVPTPPTSLLAFSKSEKEITEKESRLINSLKVAGPMLVIFGLSLLSLGLFLCALVYRLKQAERVQEYRYPLHVSRKHSLVYCGDGLTPLEDPFNTSAKSSRIASAIVSRRQSLHDSCSQSVNSSLLQKESSTEQPPSRRASINPVPTAYWSIPASPPEDNAEIVENSYLHLQGYSFLSRPDSGYSFISSHPDPYFGSDDSLEQHHDVASFPDRPNSNWTRLYGSMQPSEPEVTDAPPVPDIHITEEPQQ